MLLCVASEQDGNRNSGSAVAMEADMCSSQSEQRFLIEPQARPDYNLFRKANASNVKHEAAGVWSQNDASPF